MHQNNSRSLLDRWFKRFSYCATLDWDMGNQRCSTNFWTPCRSTQWYDMTSKSHTRCQVCHWPEVWQTQAETSPAVEGTTVPGSARSSPQSLGIRVLVIYDLSIKLCIIVDIVLIFIIKLTKYHNTVDIRYCD